MKEITMTLKHPWGLHARPAALFVQTANRFKSKIQVRNGEREANAKSIMGILSLGANQGAMITIRAEGDDAEQAIQQLESLIESNFGESA